MRTAQKDFIEFENEVRKQLERKFDGKGKVSVRSVWKNNGIRLRALSVIQSAEKVAPTIYLEDYYEKYCRGAAIEIIVDEMAAFYERRTGIKEMEIGYFADYEQVRSTLRIRLINYERNIEFLRQVPYRRFLDFAVVCYSRMESGQDWNGMIMICHPHLSMWNVTEEDLFACAMKNSREHDPESFIDMSGFMEEIKLDKDPDDIHLNETSLDQEPEEREPSGNSIRMYVLTNRARIHGATVLYYPNVLKRCASFLKSDFYILPSSIHELILLPDTQNRVEELLRMVQEVNDEQVEKEELLSYHVYFYDRTKGCLKNVVTEEEVPVP